MTQTGMRKVLACRRCGDKYPVYPGGNRACPTCFWQTWWHTDPNKRRIGSPITVGRWPKER